MTKPAHSEGNMSEEKKPQQTRRKLHYVALSGETNYNSAMNGEAYARLTISINHSDPREVLRVRNMLEAKALEVNEQFAVEAKGAEA